MQKYCKKCNMPKDDCVCELTEKRELPVDNIVMCELVKKDYYRSKPLVNMTDDMVRITLSMKRNEWVKLRKFLKRST